MAIGLPRGLPARDQLRAEGLDPLDETRTGGSPGRPLRVALINLMPDKQITEMQLARLLGATHHAVEVTLCVPGSYRSTRAATAAHVDAFYTRWPRLRQRRFDGLIVTGAPVELLDFDQVAYWSELTEIFDWAEAYVGRTLAICWAAQAWLHHAHGVPKRPLSKKAFGVFAQRVVDGRAPLFDGFGTTFPVPVSRHTEVREADLPAGQGLSVLARSDESGLCMVEDRRARVLCMFNHLEYDADTLAREYWRDRARGDSIAQPRHYFPDDDPTRTPVNTWRRHGRLFFRNWLEQVERSAHADARIDPTPIAATPHPDPSASMLDHHRWRQMTL